MLKLFSAAGKVNLEEGSTDSQGKEDGKGNGADAIAEEVTKYATDHKVSYRVAYGVVAKKHEDKLQSKRLVEEE